MKASRAVGFPPDTDAWLLAESDDLGMWVLIMLTPSPKDSPRETSEVTSLFTSSTGLEEVGGFCGGLAQDYRRSWARSGFEQPFGFCCFALGRECLPAGIFKWHPRKIEIPGV